LNIHNRNFNIPFSIKKIEYDAFRSAFISLVRFSNGIYCYQLLIYKTFINDTFLCYNNIPENLRNGDGCLIKYISAGSVICNIELSPHKGSQLSKSAGCSSLLLKKDGLFAYLKVSSSQIVTLSVYCMAFLGSISNKNYRYINLGKAGRSRFLGIRPTVRGVAMNPVDHPHGGGEGKKSKKSSPRSPWGMVTRNHKKKILIR
jgi:large subunit ribosomal protein L2